MIPGEIEAMSALVELNVGRSSIAIQVVNTGDRPVQVGSHIHFFEINPALYFDRAAAFGRRLDIPAGTAVRFEPGEAKRVDLIPIGGFRRIFGLNGLTQGWLDDPAVRQKALSRAAEQGFLGSMPVKPE